jgi:hypothetical protein
MTTRPDGKTRRCRRAAAIGLTLALVAGTAAEAAERYGSSLSAERNRERDLVIDQERAKARARNDFSVGCSRYRYGCGYGTSQGYGSRRSYGDR